MTLIERKQRLLSNACKLYSTNILLMKSNSYSTKGAKTLSYTFLRN